MSALLFVLVTSGWFLLFEAKTYSEIAQLAPTMAVGQVVYLTLFYDKSNIMQLINDLKDLIEKSKYKSTQDEK